MIFGSSESFAPKCPSEWLNSLVLIMNLAIFIICCPRLINFGTPPFHRMAAHDVDGSPLWTCYNRFMLVPVFNECTTDVRIVKFDTTLSFENPKNRQSVYNAFQTEEDNNFYKFDYKLIHWSHYNVKDMNKGMFEPCGMRIEIPMDVVFKEATNKDHSWLRDMFNKAPEGMRTPLLQVEFDEICE